MFHPIRRLKRTLRTRTRKVVATVAAFGALGGGTGISTAVAPDSIPGQVGHQVVRVITFGVDQLTGTTEDGVR